MFGQATGTGSTNPSGTGTTGDIRPTGVVGIWAWCTPGPLSPSWKGGGQWPAP